MSFSNNNNTNTVIKRQNIFAIFFDELLCFEYLRAGVGILFQNFVFQSSRHYNWIFRGMLHLLPRCGEPADRRCDHCREEAPALQGHVLCSHCDATLRMCRLCRLELQLREASAPPPFDRLPNLPGKGLLSVRLAAKLLASCKSVAVACAFATAAWVVKKSIGRPTNLCARS